MWKLSVFPPSIMSVTAVPVRPCLKWAGGKQALAEALLAAFPSKFDRYFEPFLGAGSALFALAPRRAVVCDANEWLIDTYLAIREDPDRVMDVLDRFENTREFFLRTRARSPFSLDRFERAAQLIYLNKTCFRGLFRVNRQGMFNVPYGNYDRRFYDPENLRAVALALADVEMRHGDFVSGLAGVSRGDFAYLDPPYHKQGGYADFNRYTRDQFREEDHERLACRCAEMDGDGVLWAVSNSDTAFIRKLYTGFRVQQVAARREINLNARKRDQVELLIMNY